MNQREVIFTWVPLFQASKLVHANFLGDNPGAQPNLIHGPYVKRFRSTLRCQNRVLRETNKLATQNLFQPLISTGVPIFPFLVVVNITFWSMKGEPLVGVMF